MLRYYSELPYDPRTDSHCDCGPHAVYDSTWIGRRIVGYLHEADCRLTRDWIAAHEAIPTMGDQHADPPASWDPPGLGGGF